MSQVIALTLNPAIDLSIGLARLVPGTLHRADQAVRVAAGKGHNVASVLAALGHSVTVSGFLGADNDAAHRQLFADHGLIDACIRIAGHTRTNVKIGEACGRVSDVNTPGPTVAPADWQRLLDILDTQLRARPAAIVIAGSLAPGVSPAGLGELVSRCHEHAVPVWLDTSGPALAAGVHAGCALVKPNVEELADWVSAPLADEAAILAAAAEMQAAGAARVVVSHGGEGLYACYEDTRYRLTPPQVAVVNTVCAGDTLLAGLLHGELTGCDTGQALRFACALAAEAVRHVGVGQATAPDFSDLLAQVTLTATPASISRGAVSIPRDIRS